MRSASTLPPKAVGVSVLALVQSLELLPQTPAGISEGSTKPLLQVQLGFLWNMCQLSTSHVWHLQYKARFKQKCAGKPWNILFLYALGKWAKPHFTIIPLTDQKIFSDLLGFLYHQQLQRLLFGNKILMKELLEAQSPVSVCVGIHMYPWDVDTHRDMYVEIANKSHNPVVSKECSFTESWEKALISQTATLWFS